MASRTPSKNRLSDWGEFGLIDRVRKTLGPTPPNVLGIGDDAAVLPYSRDTYLLLTTDMLVEGVHFSRSVPAGSIGHKAVAVNISDIAAMGGRPEYAVVSLGVPGHCPKKFVEDLYKGIRATAKKFGIDVVGGDTVKSRRIIINVAVTGRVRRKHMVTRSGARRGDQIFVTGPLGRSHPSGWHCRFVPRTAQAHYLVRHCRPTAMIDISDGLAADLGHILKSSRVGAVLDAKSFPRRKGASLKNVLTDGEDFELLFTVRPSAAKKLLIRRGRKFGFYRIGEIVGPRAGFNLITEQGHYRKLETKGFRHF